MLYHVAASLGAIPLAWLTLRYLAGKSVSVPSWWIASGFGVSCVTDLLVVSHTLPQWIASPVYLVSQGALITAAILPPAEAWAVLMTLVAVGEAQVLFVGVNRPDILLHTVSFLTMSLVALRARSIYRWSLGAAFGVGLVAWWAYCIAPGWDSWLAYQSCRLLGVALFCWASREPG